MSQQVLFKLDEGAQLPTRATDGSAGYDLYCLKDTKVPRKEVTHGNRETGFVMVPTGVHVAIPEGYVGLLFIRSSIAVKRHLVLSNACGVIDSDYRGEIGVPIVNMSALTDPWVFRHERVAQLVIVPCFIGTPVEVESLGETSRTGGFGSTGR